MRLVRGWEKHYVPDATGGLRLSQARLYREIGEEDGLGDVREGEIRAKAPPGEVTVTWEDVGFPIRLSREGQEQSDAEMARLIREEWGTELDDPNIEVEQQGPEHWNIRQNVKVDDSKLGSPYLLCLSREPESRTQWERLREALPQRYDTWTVTEDLSKLRFEIECGIKRWLALNAISKTVSLWIGGREGMPNSGVAQHKLFDFANPSSFRVGLNEFTAPAGAFAYQNVNYFIVLSGFGASLNIKETTSNNEDAGGETGAVIFNNAGTRGLGSTDTWWRSSTSRGSVLRMAVKGSQRDRGILLANYAQTAVDEMGSTAQEIVSVGDVITVEIDVGAADRYLIRGVSFHADGTIPGPTVPVEVGVTSTGGPIGNPMYLWDTTSRVQTDLTKAAGLFSLTSTRSHVGINVWSAPQGSTVVGANASYFVGQRPTDPRLFSVLGRYFMTAALGVEAPPAVELQPGPEPVDARRETQRDGRLWPPRPTCG